MEWFRRIKYRMSLLWTFVKMIDQAKVLEKEIQEAQQKQFDLEFASQLRAAGDGKDLCFRIGYMEGIKWCMNRVKHGR